MGRCELFQEVRGEGDSRLPLEDLLELPRIIVEAVEHELFHSVDPEFHERPQGLGREGGVDDHRERAVALPDGADAVRAGLGGSVELGIDDEHVHRMPADDGVCVRPVERGMHAMRVPGRPLEAGEFRGLDAGGDVH